MTDNEKLIEEAWWRAMEAGELPRPRGDGTARQLFEAGYRAAEKAHTPTDDEREALAKTVKDFWWECEAGEKPPKHLNGEPSAGDVALAASILAAGFHRTEVPEPSAEDWDNRDDEVNGETRGLVSCGHCSWSMRRGLFADLHEHERVHESEPQGEPSASCATCGHWVGGHDARGCRTLNCRCAPMQGEPSDTEIEAAKSAINLVFYRADTREFGAGDWDRLYREMAVTALRAAGGVR